MICLLTSEMNKTTTSCLESCYDFFLWSVPVALTPCASFVAKDALDLQGLKVSMVSTDTSRFTFGCGASMCVATDVLQLPQAPPEEPLQKKASARCPSAPVKEGIWTIPDTQQGSTTPNSSYITFSLLQLFACEFLAK